MTSNLTIHSLTDSSSTGEESLTIFLDKQKLNKKSEGNSNSSVVSLELLHQLAASYFTDRESTLRRLHHLQIATSAIKVLHMCMQPVTKPTVHIQIHICFQAVLENVHVAPLQMPCLLAICRLVFAVLRVDKQPPIMADITARIKLSLWDILLRAAPITNSSVCSQGMRTNNLFQGASFLKC